MGSSESYKCMILLKPNRYHGNCLELFLNQQFFFQGGVFYPKQYLELPVYGDNNFKVIAFKFSTNHESPHGFYSNPSTVLSVLHSLTPLILRPTGISPI